MKKSITLVLVLALVLSVFGMGVSASFSDVKENDANRTYYDLLASLKIIDGYDDGTFGADKNVTREEAVTFIYRMATGRNTAATGATKFADVAANRWSSGYIGWAVENKIIAGRDDGLFHPTDTVTVAELSKMMVIALGWPANDLTFPYGFMNKAEDLGLLKGVSYDSTNTKMVRGSVAVTTYNTLFANRFSVITLPNGSQSLRTEDAFAVVKFGLEKLTGKTTVDAVAQYDNSVAAGKVKLGYTKVDADDKFAAGTYAYNGDASLLIGREVEVFVKTNTVTNETTIISLAPKNTDKVITFKNADLKDDTDTLADQWKVTIDGTKYTIMGVATNNVVDLTEAKPMNGTAVPTAFGVRDNVTYRAIVKDGKIVDLYFFESVVAKVSGIDKDGKVSFTAVGGAAAPADIAKVQLNAYEGIAKNDYVYVSERSAQYKKADGTIVTDGNVYDVVKANVVNGVKVTAISTGAAKDATYTIGGTTYKISTEADIAKLPAIGSTYDLVLSPTGFVAANPTVSTIDTSVIGVVTGVGATAVNEFKYNNHTITVMLSDGSEKTYPVKDGNYGTTTGGKEWLAESGKWAAATDCYAKITYIPVKLELNSEGTVIGISKLSSTGDTVMVKNGIATLSTGTKTYLIDEDTVFFTIDTSEATGTIANDLSEIKGSGKDVKVTAAKGSKIPTIESAKQASHFEAKTSGNYGAKYIVLNEAANDGDKNFGYIEYLGQILEGTKTYHQYRATVDGKATLLTSEGNSIVADTNTGSGTAVVLGDTPVLVQLQVAGTTLKGFDSTPTGGIPTPTEATVMSITGSNLVVKVGANTSALVLDSNVKVYNLLTKDKTLANLKDVVMTGEALTVSNISADDSIAYVVDGTSKKVTTIYVLTK